MDEVECRTCRFWREDRGIFCVNGWTGDGEHGDCHYDRVTVPKMASDFCGLHESKDGKPAAKATDARR
jgi:hypothetical protein